MFILTHLCPMTIPNIYYQLSLLCYLRRVIVQHATSSFAARVLIETDGNSQQDPPTFFLIYIIYIYWKSKLSLGVGCRKVLGSRRNSARGLGKILGPDGAVGAGFRPCTPAAALKNTVFGRANNLWFKAAQLLWITRRFNEWRLIY